MAMRQHDAIRPKDRVDGRCSGKKRMDRRIKFICPFDLAEHSPQHSNLYAGISLLRSVRFKPRNGGTSARFNPCS